MKHTDKYDELVYKYLEAHDPTWTDKTYATESAKLKTILRVLRTSGPRGVTFYQTLKAEGYHPYTIKSLVSRGASLFDWAIKHQIQGFGPINTFADLLLSSPQLFRNAYKPERLKITFDEAMEKIKSIPQENIREACLSLIRSGLRIHEIYKVNNDTKSVIGKGDKQRFTVWAFPAHLELPSENQIRYALKKVGLKPHSLRKLLATKLARNSDFSNADIMAVFGWSSIETAAKYLQPETEAKLRNKIEEALR